MPSALALQLQGKTLQRPEHPRRYLRAQERPSAPGNIENLGLQTGTEPS